MSVRPSLIFYTWALAGSILEGQDSTYPEPGNPSTANQKKRSGVAVESLIQFYFAGTTAAVKAAIQLAITNDADIINRSASAANGFRRPEVQSLASVFSWS
jgi:hypothetical protein